ncbi:MAG TPA: ATP-binding protein, partial [Terriglobales bacterium]|nr:ATP-binding protein [Terriglobales bacterium]
CLSLARYITRPVRLLQGAVRKVAAGDLSTRVSPQLLDRKDELASLALDFDHMAERIEGLLRTQRQMLGDSSHELRTPLTRLSVAVELAEQGDTAALQRMSIEIGRINDLIEQILTVTRLDAGDRKPQLEPMDLDGLLAQIVEDGNYAGQQRKIRVELTEHSGVRVMADPSLLRTAVENIVHNAMQYTKPESTIEVASRKNDDNVLIIVRDHGSGVPASALPRIFEPFYRVSESRSEKAGGRGLGLAISQRIVSLHGGAITARNASDGGLQVEIVWPGNPQA